MNKPFENKQGLLLYIGSDRARECMTALGNTNV